MTALRDECRRLEYTTSTEWRLCDEHGDCPLMADRR